MSATLEVRFMGLFLVVLDNGQANVYFRNSFCRATAPHIPTALFDPKSCDNVDPSDRERIDLNGNRIIARPLPVRSGDLDAIFFEFQTASTALLVEASTPPSATTDSGVNLSCLPSLAAGGAISLQVNQSLDGLSAVKFALGARGKLSTALIDRDNTGKLRDWAFIDDLQNESTTVPRQQIAEVLEWTVPLSNNSVALKHRGATALELKADANSKIRLTLSNLSEIAQVRKSKRIEDFRQLLDYASQRGEIMLPELPGPGVTGGSVICPGARWP